MLTIPYFRLKEPPAFLNIDIYAVLALTPWAALQKKKIFYLCYKAQGARGSIFSRARPSYEQDVSNLDRSMHRSLWV